MKQTIYVDGQKIKNIKQAIEKAKDIGTSIDEVDIILKDGMYTVDESIVISGKDFSSLKLTIKAENEGKATVTNALIVNKSCFKNIEDDNDIDVSTEAREHILCYDIKAKNEYRKYEIGRNIDEKHSNIIYGIYSEKERYNNAKWPNVGFTKVEECLEEGYKFAFENPAFKGYVSPDRKACIKYDNERMAKWTKAKHAVIEGYFYYDFSYEKVQIKEIKLADKTITMEGGTSYGFLKDQRFLISNLIEELDMPGEFFVDSDNDKLYLYPYSDVKNIYVALSNESIFNIQNLSNLTIDGLRFAYTRERMIDIDRSSCCTVKNCIFEYCGSNAIKIDKCNNIKVESNRFYELGAGGIVINGGNREELIPACNIVKDNEFSYFSLVERTYTPAVYLEGCGNHVCNNTIHDAPHCAIWYLGNNHLIENNEIYNCAYETADVGIIYCGRNWTYRGNVIRGNLFYNNHASEVIYFDDMVSGAKAYNNIVAGTKNRAVALGGGRDIFVTNNIFILCEAATCLDDRGASWGYSVYKNEDGTDSTLLIGLKAMPYKSDLWKSFYPELFKILENDPLYPRNNVVVDNILVNTDEGRKEGKGNAEHETNIFKNLEVRGDTDKILRDFVFNNNTSEYQDSEKINKVLESFKGTWTINKFKEKYLEITECFENY